jgi:hypothetical protein
MSSRIIAKGTDPPLLKWQTAAADRASLYADTTPQNDKPDAVCKIAADLRD